MEEKAKAIANILSNRRKRKFQRDKIDLEKALNSSNKILQQSMNNKTPVLHEQQLRQKLLECQKIPLFAPLNLQKNDKPLTDDLISLCSTGPSFVPAPPHYNWLQLQKDFDKFWNSLRSRVFFANKEQNSNKTFRNNTGVNNPPKKKSNWSAPSSDFTKLRVHFNNFIMIQQKNI